jgi:transcriptional regulator with XRE-family HTH domain
MEARGLTGHSLSDQSGVPSGTTYRFLRGKHGEPKSSTLKKWAKVLHVTEAQLRGYEPIQGVLIPEEQKPDDETAPPLTRDERLALKVVRLIRKEARSAWLRIGLDLSAVAENVIEKDRRKQDVYYEGTDKRHAQRRGSFAGGAKYRQIETKQGRDTGQKQKA